MFKVFGGGGHFYLNLNLIFDVHFYRLLDLHDFSLEFVMQVPIELTWGTKGYSFVPNAKNPKKIRKIDYGYHQSAYSLQSFNCIDCKHKTIIFNVKIGEDGWDDSIGIINNTSHKTHFYSDYVYNASNNNDNINQKNIYYAIDSKGSKVSHTTKHKSDTKWIHKCHVFASYKKNDKLTFELNFSQKYIKFYKNDHFVGILCDGIEFNQNTNYSLVATSCGFMSLELLQCYSIENFSWDHEKMLWIGFEKNQFNTKCMIKILPKDIIKKILQYLRSIPTKQHALHSTT